METVERIFKILIYIAIIALLIFPYLAFVLWLRVNNKTVTFTPEFKIIDSVNYNDVDPDALQSGLDKLKDVLGL